jgi:large subunit ribosomal protein L23
MLTDVSNSPNFTLTFLRPPADSPPTHAHFIVPLNLNKLDLRDYLYNVYGVRSLGIRSYIQQQKVRQDKPGAARPRPRFWYRPRAIKKMIVELESPFVWPEVPEKFDQWDQNTYKAAMEDQETQMKAMQPEGKEKPTPERKSIAQQAKAFLKGEEDWQPTKLEVWDDALGAEEVEQDVQIPQER